MSLRPTALLALALFPLLVLPTPAEAGRRPRGYSHEAPGFQLFASPQSNPIVVEPDGSRVYVANTTTNTVEVIDTGSNSVVATVAVGLEPVGLAIRPGADELWVSNHVSDSVSVIDTAAGSGTRYRVVETIQELDSNGATLFDEPVGIAFSSANKAYVALSSTDRIAVIDAVNYAVSGHLEITAQDPRALVIFHDPPDPPLLVVAAFESNNRTEISACPDPNSFTGRTGPPPGCTLSANDLFTFAQEPNLPGVNKNIIVDTDVPDRDLFVFRTDTDALVATVSGVGTLLHGLAATDTGTVFVTQTDARNAVNGLEGENLIDLQNHMFDNQVARLSCGLGGCAGLTVFDLDPALPALPQGINPLGPGGNELATPYGLAVSGDVSTVVATAAASSRVFTMNAGTGAVLGVADLGAGPDLGQQIPRGLALVSDGAGAPQTAYVLNTLENTVSVVDVSTPSAPVPGVKIPVGSDPTPDAVRRGRIAFNSAFASSGGTFSCASCHPDGNMDQLLWRIGGACFFGPCSQDDEPRTTMPVRGLKNTLPLHWDGTLGDPIGGPNGAEAESFNLPPSCTDDHSCFLDLVTASLDGVMCDQNNCSGGELNASERSDMADFLASVVYPPARSRPMDDQVTTSARDGFADFFVDQGGASGDPDTCADNDAGCHELPLGAATNSNTLGFFDAPTMRGLTDRFVQFSLGVTAAEESLVFANAGTTVPFVGTIPPLEPSIQWDPAKGFKEVTTLGSAFLIFDPIYNVRPLDIWQMIEQASTGFPGSQGRQVSLNTRTTNGALLAETEQLMLDLESADDAGLVNLRAWGIRIGVPTLLTWDSASSRYRRQGLSLTHSDLLSDAQSGNAVVTLTATLRENFGDANHSQPLLAPDPNSCCSGPTGDPNLPTTDPMDVLGVDVRSDALIWVDGVKVAGAITCLDGGGFTPYCDSERIEIDFTSQPSNGLRLIQVQNPKGPLSNELPACFGNANNCD